MEKKEDADKKDELQQIVIAIDEQAVSPDPNSNNDNTLSDAVSDTSIYLLPETLGCKKFAIRKKLLDEGHAEKPILEREALIRAAWGYDKDYKRIKADPVFDKMSDYHKNSKLVERVDAVNMEA